MAIFREESSRSEAQLRGLLLTESEQLGKSIRAGTFTSRAREAGGTKYFDAKEFVRMEII